MTETAHKKTFGFQAEVKQLLHLMIHSLYSNKEIFLRELISNASDAIDRLKFESLNNPSLMAEDPNFKIEVEYHKSDKTITIRDNGVGMSESEMIQHLGTIAKSGTREFLNSLSGDKAKDSRLIGQFGVGFYAAFIVADKVTVISRRAGTPKEQSSQWESKGDGEYTLETCTKDSRGTDIILHLKPDQDEFLNGWKLRHIIQKYSDHIAVPILMPKEEHGDSKDPSQNNEQTHAPDMEAVNRAKALWVLPKQDITDEQYKELYKHIAHDFQDPLLWTHNKVEGKLEYISLLYIPTRAPFDLWNPSKPRGLKLYVQRVFIMDDVEQFLPLYLRFVRGIIDSNNLPLNISREILQSNREIDSMRSALTKRVLGLLEQIAKEDSVKYQTFWKEFGQILKEGPAEDFANREQILKLLRFSSTHQDTEDEGVSLEDYVSRMLPNQDKIYFAIADSFQAAKNSPHLEIFRKKGIEVLLLFNRIDEWLMTHITEFSGKHFQSVARGDLDLSAFGNKDNQTEVPPPVPGDYEVVLTKTKEVLGDQVKAVRLSHRLTQSPVCLVLEDQDLSNHMVQLLKAAGQKVDSAKPILELNSEHVLIKQLKDLEDPARFKDWVEVLFDQARLLDGGHLADPAKFVMALNKLLANQ